MCHYQTLAYSADGYMVRCPDCKRIQMAFGTTIVTLDTEAFKELAAQIELETLCERPMAMPEQKSIIIHVGTYCMLGLTVDELCRLSHLLHQAFPLLTTYEILETAV